MLKRKQKMEFQVEITAFSANIKEPHNDLQKF